jgi:RNA polymerase sigma-70 factor (ECF subfamily)
MAALLCRIAAPNVLNGCIMFQRQKQTIPDKHLDVAHIDASATEHRRAEWGDTSKVESTDEELIERLASGELAALDMLYTRYARPVFSLALRILGDSADAEEVAQDVFERVWRHAPTYDAERGRFGTWLLSMTHHVAIDRVRKRQRRPQQVVAEAGEWTTTDPPSGQDVPESVLRNLQAEQVRRALHSLPSAQQQAIELAYFGGLSHLEIAAVLGDPLGTVKARIRRGMDRLRSALERYVTEGEEI